MVQRRQPAARGRVARSLTSESSAVATAHGMARFAPFANGLRDDLDRFQRGLTELDVTDGLALDPLAFGLQIGLRLLQLADQPVQLLDRRRRDLLDERRKLVASEAGSGFVGRYWDGRNLRSNEIANAFHDVADRRYGLHGSFGFHGIHVVIQIDGARGRMPAAQSSVSKVNVA